MKEWYDSTMNEEMIPTYTGEISLARWDDDKDDYVDLLNLEAFGETDVEVMRKLAGLIPVVKHMAPALGVGSLPGVYISITYPTFGLSPDAHHTAGFAVQDVEHLSSHIAFAIQIEVNHTRRSVFKAKTPNSEWFVDHTDEQWVAELNALLDSYEAELKKAIADGTWAEYTKKRKRAQRERTNFLKMRKLARALGRENTDVRC